MDFTQKIYFNDKPLILTTNAKAYIEKHTGAENYLVLTGATKKNVKEGIRLLEKVNIKGVLLEDVSSKDLRESFYSIYKPVHAGGGVVLNEKGAVLMIFRRGKWDLPKGKLDDGESIEECSVREVVEETGLEKVKLGEKICDTYHIYSQNNKNLLKCTAWYKMKGTIHDNPVPQADEGIKEVKWVLEKDLAPYVFKSYAAIREVLLRSGLKWF
ncbi:MAG: NUDIX domain-containing protein [Flavipsychrobacter sp.]